MHNPTTRRSFLKCAPLAAVAVSAPVMAVTIAEAGEAKIERMVQELRAALAAQSGTAWVVINVRGAGAITLADTGTPNT
jgi:hypothetical protein